MMAARQLDGQRFDSTDSGFGLLGRAAGGPSEASEPVLVAPVGSLAVGV
jgi:hypothetical protein